MRMKLASDTTDIRILLDRGSALDVAALVVDGIDLSPGSAIPSDGDPRIDHALKGFLFTCGPDHIRHPEPVAGDREDGLYPLHGSLSGTPAAGPLREASDTGCGTVLDIALADGGVARLHRTWSTTAMPGSVLVVDRIENVGETAFPPMWMYHVNMAGRLFGDAVSISGSMVPDGRLPWRFGSGESAHVCLTAQETEADGWATVRIGPFAALAGRSVDIRFDTRTLPFLQMWRCQRGEANVVSIEPVSHPIARREALMAAGKMPVLRPGESIDYRLAFAIIGADGQD